MPSLVGSEMCIRDRHYMICLVCLQLGVTNGVALFSISSLLLPPVSHIISCLSCVLLPRALLLYTPCIHPVCRAYFIRRFQEGLAFLAANKLKEGVVETASGLQYKVLKSGPDGGKTPLKTTKCLCHYKGECCGVCLLQHGL